MLPVRDYARKLLPFGLLHHGKLMCALQAAPEFCGGAEVAGKPDGGVRADAASLAYDVCDARARYADGERKSVRC